MNIFKEVCSTSHTMVRSKFTIGCFIIVSQVLSQGVHLVTGCLAMAMLLRPLRKMAKRLRWSWQVQKDPSPFNTTLRCTVHQPPHCVPNYHATNTQNSYSTGLFIRSTFHMILTVRSHAVQNDRHIDCWKASNCDLFTKNITTIDIWID